MKAHPISSTFAAAIAGLALATVSATAQVVFTESFEDPVVSGFASNTVPSGGRWIGANQGFGSTNRGLYNETVVWPANPVFTTPFGKQAYYLNYSNSALTTAAGVIGTLAAGVPYTVTFNAGVISGDTAGNMRVELVAFSPGEARNDARSVIGTVLATASGSVTTSDLSQTGGLTFTAAPENPHLGKDLAIRLFKSTGSVLYDNIRLITGHDYNPTPASGRDLAVGGNVTLGWTNLPPNAPATETPVDIWFGTNPASLTRVVTGQTLSSTVASAPVAGSYFWRIDSYPDGDPSGTPVASDVFSFTIADTDGDGIPDAWETQYFGSGTAADANADPDNDGLTNLQEFIRGTHPTNPDTDNDGLLDGVETATGVWVGSSNTGTHPLVADTDGDGLLDGAESNTGIWVSASDTGTSPVTPDTDGDGLLDSWETNTGVFVSRTNTGTNPHIKDTDNDGVWDYYEVAAAFTDPNDANDTPSVPYPLPTPDPSDTGVTNKPVKVYIMSGQSNMLGFGKVSGTADSTLNSITRRFNRFPNLLGPGGEFLARPDVRYRGVYSGIANMQLAPGGGKDSDSIGPELGFGHVMGWYHDEPVLLLKSSIGNRSLGWDILPPGSPSYQYGGFQYAGYGQSPTKWEIGTTPTPGTWYAGKEFDGFFTDESEWAHPGTPVTNVVDVLDNFATQYPQWADQGFEIAGFAWWQGDKDRYDMGHATQYEQNLVNLITSLRNYYTNRYPGKVVPNAPFVLATLGQTPLNTTNAAEKALLDAKLAVDGDSGKYPEFAGNVKTVYAHPLSQGGASNSHYNLNAETYMLVGDALGVAMLEMQDDTSPPSPNPLTFAIAPTAVDATTVGMVATAAADVSGPVEYYFENMTNNDTSGWITATRWDNTGLAAGSYDYRVKARDSIGNEGDWSATVSASPGSDVTAPAPAPAFTGPLTVLGENSISMAATAASDINGVEYSFACTVGGGPDSGWQAGTEFTALGLSPGTEYTYVVRARDSIGNVTADSAPATATTTAPDTAAPTPDPMTFASAPAAVGTNAISMTATAATDESGVEYYFEAVNGGTSSGWQDSPTYTDGDLSPGTEYGYRVRARDKSPAQNTTAWSDVLSATTEVPDTTPPSPDPMTFAIAPSATGPNSITMTATTATDPNDVVYWFANVTLGTNSGWQSSPVFTDTGLDPETEYVYQVKARDLSEGLNETAFSATSAATTSPAPSGPGGAVVYEPFEQTAGTIANKAGGLGLNNWTTSGTAVTVVNPPDLTYGDLSGIGGQANLVNNAGIWAATSPTSALADAGLLDDGATLWFSYVFRKTAHGGSNEHSGFAFASERVNPAFNGLNLSAAGYGLGVYTNGNTVSATSWSNSNSRTAGTGSAALQDSTPETPANDGFGATLVIGKIQWGADNESLTVYTRALNNIAEEPTSGGSTRSVAGFDQKALLDTISFGQRNSGGVHTYDEIRFGATYEDVIGLGGGDPEPGPVASFEISPIASPQTVGTPITGITITAKDAENATATGFTGTVDFSGTGGFSGTSGSFVAGVLSGVSVTPTVAGADLTLIVTDHAGASTGSVTIAMIRSQYAGWSGDLPFTGDANGDGVENGLAFLLGAPDPNANASGLLPVPAENAGGLTLSFQMRNAASRGTAVMRLEYSGDLGGSAAWTAVTVPDVTGTVGDVSFTITPNGNMNDVSATIPAGAALDGKLFGRLKGNE